MLIFVLCAIPGRDLPHISFLEILEFDKWVHAGVFFVLVVLLIRGFSLQTTYDLFKRFPGAIAFVLSVLYGGMLELMQEAFFSDRTADILDFVANSFGCILGLLLFKKINERFLIRYNR